MSILSLLISSILVTGILAAQDVKVKHVPIADTSAASGAEMFSQYCAVCHGAKGKGDGPASPALKARPTDLTQLSAKNGGSFPELKVVTSLRSGSVTAHGSDTMPVWGPLLSSLSSDKRLGQMRLSNLTAFVKSLQEK